MPVTEFVTISLKPGSEIGNPDNHAAPAVKEGTETIASQDGCQNLQFGTLVERPNELQLIISKSMPSASQKPAASILR